MYYSKDNYYQEYLLRIREKIVAYLNSENIPYNETARIDTLAKIADNAWVKSKQNRRRIPDKHNKQLTPELLKEMRVFFVTHTRKETAEEFGYTESTIRKYATKYGFKHPKEFTSNLRRMNALGNKHGVGKRKKKVLYKNVEKVDPEILGKKIIKFR